LCHKLCGENIRTLILCTIHILIRRKNQYKILLRKQFWF
jgi:hypothetical protein